MAYWIFKYNPEKYRLDDRLADPNPEITWTVSRYRDEIAPGDTIFIWQTGRDRGIRAVLRAEAVPQDMAEIDSELPYWTQGENHICCRVRATIIERDVNLPHTELRTVPGLESLSVFHGFQQTSNFRVRPAEGAIILGLIQGGRTRSAEPRS
jgi:hypothetical protein